MFADGDAGLDLLAAGGAIAQAHGDVRPFAFGADSHSGAAMQVRNLAKGMAARPERVALGDQAMIVGVAARGGGGELLRRGPGAGADEDAVVVKILQEIVGDFARGNRERQAPTVAEVNHIAARRDQQERERLADPPGSPCRGPGGPVFSGDGFGHAGM